MKPGGMFIFNIEHPIFTSGLNEDWIYDTQGRPEYWAIDNYFISGERQTSFLGQTVHKFHHTLTEIFTGLLQAGFKIENVLEPIPPESMMSIPEMKNEQRRPMMLIVKSIK